MTLFPGAREYTVEAGRPDTITRGKLLVLKRLGIGRISINPQTMNDETLRLNRPGPHGPPDLRGLCAGAGAGI